MKGFDNMILFSDQKEKHKTPASVYMPIADFAIILNDIAKGVIPTGSQMPYPLFSEEDLRKNQENQTLPWDNQPMPPYQQRM